jgi:hypothetical protein
VIAGERRTALGAVIVACALGCARGAAADGSSDIVAEELFTSGRALLEQGQTDAACAKLAESERLDPAGGTALLLAMCLEQQGKLASAWATFRAARAMAVRDGRPDRIAIAEQRLTALDPQLERLAIRVPPSAVVPGLEVSLDGVPLGEASRDVPLPVDPGPHAVRATAPGYLPFATTVSVVAGGGTREATVAPLAREPAPSRVVPMLGVGAVGVVGLGVSTYFGVEALNAKQGIPRTCLSDDRSCLDRSSSLESQRSTDATVSTIGAAVAVAALVGEVLLLVLPTSSRTREKAWTLTPFATAGAAVTARF